jgi:hypothetical protein
LFLQFAENGRIFSIDRGWHLVAHQLTNRACVDDERGVLGAGTIWFGFIAGIRELAGAQELHFLGHIRPRHNRYCCDHTARPQAAQKA